MATEGCIKSCLNTAGRGRFSYVQNGRLRKGKKCIKREVNKIYASGKTLDEVYSNLQKEPNYFKFIMENK